MKNSTRYSAVVLVLLVVSEFLICSSAFSQLASKSGATRAAIELRDTVGRRAVVRTIQVHSNGKCFIREWDPKRSQASAPPAIEFECDIIEFLDLFNRFLAVGFFELPVEFMNSPSLILDQNGLYRILTTSVADGGSRSITLSIGEEEKTITYTSAPGIAPVWLFDLGKQVERFAEFRVRAVGAKKEEIE